MNTLSKIRFSIVFNWRKRNNSIIEKPIHIRATQHRKTIYLPTGIEVAPNQWSKKNKRIVDHPLADIFNKKLYDQLFEVEAYEMQLVRQEKGEWIPVELIKEYRNADNTGFRNFNEFCQYELEHSTIKPNTKRTQKSHLKLFFTAFKKDKPVYFREVNVSLVKRFDRFVKSLEAVNSQNTVWGYHKTLKTYINRAIGEELIKENPYDTYKVKRERDENVKRT